MTAREFFIGFLICLGLAALGIWGEAARLSNEQRHVAQDVHLKEQVVEATAIQVDMTDAKLLGGVGMTTGKYPTPYRFWTGIEAKGWMLLNGDTGAATCREALEYFAKANKPYAEFNASALDLLLSSLNGKTVTIAAFVPTYTQAPAGLENCLGYSFDAETGRLKVGSRFVAIMSGYQPGFMALPSEK